MSEEKWLYHAERDEGREDFEHIWRTLNRRPASAEETVASDVLHDFARLEAYFEHVPECRFYVLDTLTAEEETEIGQHGLRISVMRENLERSVRRGTRRSSKDVRLFQLDAVRDCRLYAICPFTGRHLTSRTSFPVTREVVFYRFEGPEVFYIATHHLGAGFTKGAIYFPEREIVVKLRDFIWEFRQEHVVKLKTLMVSSVRNVSQYLRGDSDRAGAAVCLGDANYAHHLWNELSGLLRLSRTRNLSRVKRFLVFREPLGPISRLFPQIRLEAIQHVPGCSDVRDHIPLELFREILDQNYFVVNVGDDYISEDIIRRIRRTFASLPKATIKKVRQARRAHWPLVFVSIRTGNRTWIDQAAGLSTILANLKGRYPRLGVVVDGYSLAMDYETETSLHPWLGVTPAELDVLALEAEVIGKISDELAKAAVACFPISGCSLLETALWAEAIDFYVTHAGSNQHKVGWLANKPGIVHSNVALLRSKPSYYASAREFGLRPQFMDARFVRDVEVASERQATDLRSDLKNYTVDIAELQAETERMAQALGRRRRGTRAVMFGFAQLLQRVYRSRVAHDVTRRLKRSTPAASLRSLKVRIVRGRRHS